MFIGPIDYNRNDYNYKLVKNRKKVTPVSKVDDISNDRSNNDSTFEQCLEEEIEKIKKKSKKKV